MIVTQTNDGLSTANSYVTTAELSAYASQRGIVLNSADLDSLLFKSMDVLESKQYKSEPFNDTQSTQFPRMGVGIPRPIKQAQILLAVAADTNDLLSATTEQITKSEQVDVIKVEYFENKDAVNGSPLLTLVNELLEPYLASTKQWAANVRVYRG